jgi:predicted small lipoprotein YifL
MSKLKKAIFYLFLIALLTGLSGCESEGPMERTGKKIDKAVEDTEKAIKEASKKKDEKKE